MTNQKYIPQDNQWIDFQEFEPEQYAEDVYQQVGTRFPLSINADGTVQLNPAELPDGISENDAKQAIRDNHPHR